MAFKARDYQVTAGEELRAETWKRLKNGERANGIIVLPTGGGKTPVAFQDVVKRAVAKGKRVLFLAHTQELIMQASGHCAAAGMRHGIIMAGHEEDRTQPVQIGSIQTVVRREFPDVDLVLVDECHHCRAETYGRVLKHYIERGVIVIGFTATPQRLDGRGLGTWFDFIVEPTTVRELIDRKFLTDYRYFAPHVPDLSGIRKIGGDFSKRGLKGVMDKRRVTGDIVTHYQKHLSGKRAMVFAAGIQHSMNIIQAFLAQGITAAHLDGKTPKKERLETIEAFKAGRILVISNVGLFGEGVDIPDMAGVIIARPTDSMSMHRQMIGRALRLAKDKPYAVILDHAGNWMRHGAPCDITEWDLEDKEKKPEAPKHKRCKRCLAVLPVHLKECPACGYKFRSVPRQGPEFKDGDLKELKPKKWTREEKAALYDMLLGTAMRNGWLQGAAARRYKAKVKVWPRGFADIKEKWIRNCEHVKKDEATGVCRFCRKPLGLATVDG